MQWLKDVSAADRRLFQSTFGHNLAEFWDTVPPGLQIGFDVVKFDKDLVKPPDGTSTKEQVLKDYGQEAVDLCLRLLAQEAL